MNPSTPTTDTANQDGNRRLLGVQSNANYFLVVLFVVLFQMFASSSTVSMLRDRNRFDVVVKNIVQVAVAPASSGSDGGGGGNSSSYVVGSPDVLVEQQRGAELEPSSTTGGRVAQEENGGAVQVGGAVEGAQQGNDPAPSTREEEDEQGRGTTASELPPPSSSSSSIPQHHHRRRHRHHHLWLLSCETRNISKSLDYQAWYYSAMEFAKNQDINNNVTVHIENVCENKKWESFYTKFSSMYEFMTKTFHDVVVTNNNDADDGQQEQHLVMFGDSDSIFNSYGVTPNDLVNRYYAITSGTTGGDGGGGASQQNDQQGQLRHKVVIAGEPACYVGFFCNMNMLHSPKHYGDADTGFARSTSCGAYVNSGQYMGPPDLLYDMLSTMRLYNNSNGDYIGKPNDDQGMMTQWYFDNKKSKAVLDRKASIFRPLTLGWLSHLPEHKRRPRDRGFVCGAGTNGTGAEWKTCGLYDPPLWDITNYTTTHASTNADDPSRPIIRINPNVPGCDDIEEIPVAIHGNGPWEPKLKFREYVKFLTNGKIQYPPGRTN